MISCVAVLLAFGIPALFPADAREPALPAALVPEDSRPAAPFAYKPDASLRGINRESRYLTMRDGTKIAIDVWSAPGMRERRSPTLIHQTRYWRRTAIRFPFSLFRSPLDLQGPVGEFKRKMLAAGYVWVDVDTRGSGASFGSRPWDYSPDEVRDGGEIIDWIARQTWSNGRVASVGVSYPGSTAEFAIINRSPALGASVVISAPFDQYQDILAPGGIPLTFYMAEWGRLTGLLDRNKIPGASTLVNIASPGVAAVDGDMLGRRRAAAVREHRDNYAFQELLGLTFRDDLPIEAGHGASEGRLRAQAQSYAWLESRFGPDFRRRGIDLASAHAYLDDLKAAPGPVYTVAGWFDGTYANAAARRFRSRGHPGDRLLLGPWDHSYRNISPYSGGSVSGFDIIGEMAKFLDGTIGANRAPLADQARVHYYTMGAERWRAAPTWPPPSTPTRYPLAAGRRLDPAPPRSAEATEYRVDFEASTGRHSRYDTLLGRALSRPYPDRRDQASRLATFDGPPLADPVEVTGHPVADLWFTSTATDGAVFVYLEDVWPDGRVTYVTEGMLRALHRAEMSGGDGTWQPGPYRSFRRADARPIVPGEPFRMRFALLPTSYTFLPGHRIRISIAGADAAHFARIPADEGVSPILRILNGPDRPSFVELPVVATP
jgi:hypothetical protein